MFLPFLLSNLSLEDITSTMIVTSRWQFHWTIDYHLLLQTVAWNVTEHRQHTVRLPRYD